MNSNFNEVLNSLQKDNAVKLLLKGVWGLEKEALRVTPEGRLALSGHPAAFGNKLTNPEITTDFSESQLEMITAPADSIDKTYDNLTRIQSGVEKALEGELLWPLSMPGILPEEHKIPIARYDGSDEGRENEIYRNGLAIRYGKKMQMISGIHYNFSFSKSLLKKLYKRSGKKTGFKKFRNDVYFKTARNFLRYRWLLLYFFGASPVADKTYEQEFTTHLKIQNKQCSCIKDIRPYNKNHTTSLRMSRFGYSNEQTNDSYKAYNSLDEYIQFLQTGLNTRSEKYSKIGVCRDGVQIQLNDNLFQKESEYYSPIRFKQKPIKGESQIEALQKRGVDYIELRIFDINPFEKAGISKSRLYFLHLFLLYCLLQDSPALTNREYDIINKNHHLTALKGRKKGLKLYAGSRRIFFESWAKRILKDMYKLAFFLDREAKITHYRSSLRSEYRKLYDKNLLPSSMILKAMKKEEDDYIRFGLRAATENLRKEA